MGEGGEILWCEGRVIRRLRHSIISISESCARTRSICPLSVRALIDGPETGGLDQTRPARGLRFDVGHEFRSGLPGDVQALRCELGFHVGIGMRAFGGLQE